MEGKKKGILGDHKLYNKKLQSPFNTFLSKGTFNETPYIRLIIPEIIWQAILNEKLGVSKASEVTLNLIKVLDTDKSLKPLCFISNFTDITGDQIRKIRSVSNQNENLITLTENLKVLIRIFPDCPLKILYRDYEEKASANDIKYFKEILHPLLNKISKESTISIASCIYYMFETDRFKVNADSQLLNLNEITYYPDTEKSKMVASSLRASLNFFVGNELFLEKHSVWSKYFWNTAHELEPCKIDNLYFE